MEKMFKKIWILWLDYEYIIVMKKFWILWCVFEEVVEMFGKGRFDSEDGGVEGCEGGFGGWFFYV